MIDCVFNIWAPFSNKFHKFTTRRLSLPPGGEGGVICRLNCNQTITVSGCKTIHRANDAAGFCHRFGDSFHNSIWTKALQETRHHYIRKCVSSIRKHRRKNYLMCIVTKLREKKCIVHQIDKCTGRPLGELRLACVSTLADCLQTIIYWSAIVLMNRATAHAPIHRRHANCEESYLSIASPRMMWLFVGVESQFSLRTNAFCNGQECPNR